MTYLRSSLRGVSPQSEPMLGQIANSAGGYSYPVDDWVRLQRFLVLGSEGGSYYASERALTKENAHAVLRCIAEDGARAVREIVAISEAGRAPKNDPALFALALAASADNVDTRQAAFAALPRVARIGTHLLHFVAYVEMFRGWGRGLRRAVASWFNDKAIADVEFQALKYAQRDGWSMRDLLRLSHPRAATTAHDWLYKAITQPDALSRLELTEMFSRYIPKMFAASTLTKDSDPRSAAQIIRHHALPREAIPSELLTHSEVWEALLERMPMEAMVRNLATMTRVGLLSSGSDATRLVVARLRNRELVIRARLHPIKALAALMTYRSGAGYRSDATWTPVPEITSALNDTFDMSFGAVEPSNKRTLIALDVSGSMSMGAIAGMGNITPRIGSAAMARVTIDTEPWVQTMAFTHGLVPLDLRNKSLEDTVEAVSGLPFGGTDCALPMQWALENRVPVDTFVIYTDSETWHGRVHPAAALRRYREQMGIAAKLIVCGMVANQFTIADPKDGGMLDVVGFDTAAPQVMADFAR